MPTVTRRQLFSFGCELRLRTKIPFLAKNAKILPAGCFVLNKIKFESDGNAVTDSIF